MRDWSEFDKFGMVINGFMPAEGEGSTMASQICTAVNKLVYKWYNDGDVFDNTHGMCGWANDLSSYANWLYEHVYESRDVLDEIERCFTDGDYEDLLYSLCEACLDLEDLEYWDREDKVGSIYTETGKFRFEEYDDEEDEW